jgi:hypothetical protein
LIVFILEATCLLGTNGATDGPEDHGTANDRDHDGPGEPSHRDEDGKLPRLGTNEKRSEEAVHRYLEAADGAVDFGPVCCSSRVVARADRALTLPKPFEMRSFGPPVPTVGPSSGTTAFPP